MSSGATIPPVGSSSEAQDHAYTTALPNSPAYNNRLPQKGHIGSPQPRLMVILLVWVTRICLASQSKLCAHFQSWMARCETRNTKLDASLDKSDQQHKKTNELLQKFSTVFDTLVKWIRKLDTRLDDTVKTLETRILGQHQISTDNLETERSWPC